MEGWASKVDTSERYVRMCRQAKEVQETWDMHNNDWYIDADSKWVSCIQYCADGYCVNVPDGVDKYDPEEIDKDEFTASWLPTQDQLQFMVLKTGHPIYSDYSSRFSHLVDMRDWWDAEDIEITAEYLTVEQLWLAYVMYVKHSKRWDKDRQAWITYTTG